MDYVEYIEEPQVNYMRAPITTERMNIIVCAFIISEFSSQVNSYVPFVIQFKEDPNTHVVWYLQLRNRASNKVVLGGYIKEGYIELWQRRVKEILLGTSE